jgi:hypothetical protein
MSEESNRALADYIVGKILEQDPDEQIAIIHFIKEKIKNNMESRMSALHEGMKIAEKQLDEVKGL